MSANTSKTQPATIPFSLTLRDTKLRAWSSLSDSLRLARWAATPAVCLALLVDSASAQSIGGGLGNAPGQCQDDSVPDEVNEGGEGDSSFGECEDWDVLLGGECSNDFPPGELPTGDPGEDGEPGGETDGGDTGGGDTGGEPPDVIVESYDCDNCEIIETDGGGVIIWINEGDGDTGGDPGGDTGGDTGSASTMADESVFAAYVFDHAVVGSQLLLTDRVDEPSVAAIHRVVGREIVQHADGSLFVQVDLQTAYSSVPMAFRHRFQISKCSTAVSGLN